MEMTVDLFQSDLINQKMEYFRKTEHKNLDWIFKADLRLLNDEESLCSFISELVASNSLIACDSETTGLGFSDKLCGISLAFEKDGHIIAGYVPMYSDIEKVGIPPEKSLALLKPILEKPLIFRNAKFDWKVFKKVGIEAGILADISIMEIVGKGGLEDSELNHFKNMTLKERYAEIFNEHMLDLTDILGKNIYSFAFAPFEAARLYASADAYATLRIYKFLLPSTDTNNFIYKLETMLIRPVAMMELNGITVDVEVLKEAKEKILKEQKQYQDEIFKLSGKQLNLNSSDQLGELLFETLKLPCYKFTPGGEKSTDHESLEMTLNSLSKDDASLAEEFKIGKQILEIMFKYKENEKLITAFVQNLMNQIDNDGKVHTNFNIIGAISLRFSSNSPNLQQLPKADDDSEEEENKAYLRKAFIASKGYYFLSCDFSQVELKIGASFSQDPNMLDAFKTGVDVHKRTASLLFSKPMEEVTKKERSKAKTLGFGLLYGMGPNSLARKLKCSYEEAEVLYNKYFEKLPAVRNWLKLTRDFIKNNGYSYSYWDWRRLLPDAKLPVNWKDDSPESKRLKKLIGEAIRAGINHRIQSTSSNITGISICRLDKNLKGKDVKMLVQIHDQIIFEVNEKIMPEEIVPIIRDCMELKLTGFVPLTIDTDIGYSWGNLTPWKPGLTQFDVSCKEKIIISGPIVEKAAELKALFKEFPGENLVYFCINDTVIQPETVDNDTGEVTETRVLASKKLIKRIEDLGLKIR